MLKACVRSAVKAVPWRGYTQLKQHNPRADWVVLQPKFKRGDQFVQFQRFDQIVASALGQYHALMRPLIDYRGCGGCAPEVAIRVPEPALCGD